jgi:hypothetical protein
MSITKGSSTTMTHLRTVRLAMLAGTVLITAVVLAACGSSSNTSSSGASSGSSSASAAAGRPSSAARSKLVACLKSHGVTLPNRPPGAQRRPSGGGEGDAPPGGGGGFFFGGPRRGGSGGTGGPGGRVSNPKFRAAFQACGGGQFQRRRFTPNKAAVTKFVACVKQHGYDLPTPDFSGKGPIFPATISRNKKFQAAARACASDLRPQGAPGASGGGGGSSGNSGGGSNSD